MKNTIEIAYVILITLLGQSCNESKPPLTTEGEVISRLQLDKTQSDSYRKSAGLLLDVLEEKENIKIRDFLNAEREVSTVRSLATVQAWIALLEATEKKLPESLPSAEEMKLESSKRNSMNSTVIDFTVTIRLRLIGVCISDLSSLDMPEAKSAVDSFLKRFEKKYGNSSGGKKMLESYRLERRQQEKDVKRGIAPWQIGPHPGTGVS